MAVWAAWLPGVAVVTGGNKGIGFEVCRQLASGGITVILTAQDETRGGEAAERLKALGLSVVYTTTAAASKVNNAAVCGVECGQEFDINEEKHIGNEEVRQELNDVDNLTQGRLDELLEKFIKDFEAGALEMHGWPTKFSAYKVAKAAMNAYSRILARRHPELRVNCAHPGFVKTDMSMGFGVLTPEEGARNLAKVALLPGGGPTGAYFTQGEEAPFVIAVVTGGNKGIGFEVCRQLASHGVAVVLTARDEPRGAEAVEKLRALGLAQVIFHQLDVTDTSSIATLFVFLKTRFGKLDILVNNAAIGGVEYLQELHANEEKLISNEEVRQELNDIDNLTEERLDELLDRFLRDFEADALEARGWPMGCSAYKVAKAAMNAYSRLLSRRHPALRVNCVHPGYVKTGITMNSGVLTPEEGARNVVKVALAPEGGPTGKFFAEDEEASFV
ncbi:(+)-neomenthol dehydrogenase [Triticum urartu]|uniref:(+)-neomenthol dehydrogenase n=1 Tax=Triticum urartu TaxID=4572 RepID=M7ZFP7_TRIUA|nr:(+)-neomenthol dehydrogenase [Triticum urartu]